MKSKTILVAIAGVAIATLCAGHAMAAEKGLQLAANMNTSDQAMANGCIAKFTTDGKPDTRAFMRKLSNENFLLSKVQFRERRQEPERVRLGFSFHNKLDVINIYMEADCPAELVDPHLPARSAQAKK